MSNMKTYKSGAPLIRSRQQTPLGQRGALNVLALPLILLAIFLVASLGFGFWAYGSRQDYKGNVDQKIAAAVKIAQDQQQQTDAKQYAEQAKQPFDTYIGPSAFGNINLKYPKTWSAYVITDATNSNPVDGFFHPSFVPDATRDQNNFALRIQVTQTSYDNVLQQYSGQVENKQLTVAPYSLPKVPSVVGSRLEGQLDENKQGVMIVLPLRNMTLKIWTESNDFKSDLDNNILPNFTFQP
jgi:hypothetical protein